MTYVWCAAYGSNMDKSRFLCYIKGGKAEGMQRTCSGSRDKSQPKKILWKTLPHRLFFGRESTKTWGDGGVAFLHPESNVLDKAYLCLYKITLEQFNDVLAQENGLRRDMTSPLFDSTALGSIASKRSNSVEVLERGWYRNVVYLGKEEGVPILTTTCTLSDIEKFKSGELPTCEPAKEYVDTFVRGLVEGKQLSIEEAGAYIKEAYTKALTPEIPLSPWRSELAMTYVWYATYGSNMDKSRFLCYIKGGKVEGMKRTYNGSRDKSQPKKILWKTLSHRLFFGRESPTWGDGGVAFLHPESNVLDKAYLCLYKIALEQFNDVLAQENGLRRDMTSPLFDSTALGSIASKRSNSVEVLERGWYRNVVYLGEEDRIPILTMTCALSDIESFKSGKLPMCAPAEEYVNTLVRGLVEGKQLSKEEARAYIKEASTKAL